MQPTDPNTQQPLSPMPGQPFPPMPPQEPGQAQPVAQPQMAAPMPQAMPMQQPIQQAASQPMQGQASYMAPCWYNPTGTRLTTAAVKGIAYVYPGMLIIYDELTNQEARRWPLQGPKSVSSKCRSTGLFL
jgi:hypothetical protein